MKLKWKVAEPPTGRYRSFHRRGWPTADFLNGKPAVMLSCDDAYSPRRARGELAHAEIRVSVADHSTVTTDGRPTFTWRTAAKRATTLAEAKEIALKVLEAHPDFWPKVKP